MRVARLRRGGLPACHGGRSAGAARQACRAGSAPPHLIAAETRAAARRLPPGSAAAPLGPPLPAPPGRRRPPPWRPCPRRGAAATARALRLHGRAAGQASKGTEVGDAGGRDPVVQPSNQSPPARARSGKQRVLISVAAAGAPHTTPRRQGEALAVAPSQARRYPGVSPTGGAAGSLPTCSRHSLPPQARVIGKVPERHRRRLPQRLVGRAA